MKNTHQRHKRQITYQGGKCMLNVYLGKKFKKILGNVKIQFYSQNQDKESFEQ